MIFSFATLPVSSYLMSVVLPAPRKPEIMLTLTIAVFLLFLRVWRLIPATLLEILFRDSSAPSACAFSLLAFAHSIWRSDATLHFIRVSQNEKFAAHLGSSSSRNSIIPHSSRSNKGKIRKKRQKQRCPNALAGASSFCNNKNQETWECAAKGSRGRPQSPLVAPVGAIPFATNGTKQQKKKGCRSSTDKQHPKLLIPFSPDAESRFSFSPPLFSAGRKGKSRDAAAPP